MGVKFGREYRDIVGDLTAAIGQIRDCYAFLNMDQTEWEALLEEERSECLKTLADDVFFALGARHKVQVGCGTLTLNSRRHVITVALGDNRVSIVNLV